MANNNQSFFQRLTRIFASGPAIQRKVKGYDKRSFYNNQMLNTNLGYRTGLPYGFGRENTPFGLDTGYGIIDRIARYSEYITMNYTPEIARALDILAEETVGGDDRGKCFHVYSNNTEIRAALEELFYDTLNVEFNLKPWTRNMPVKYDTMIPLLNGEIITIKELSDRLKNKENIWVYSVQDSTNNIVPGKVTWCDKNYNSNEIIRVTLDDNTFVEVAPEHPFILRNGKQKRADELNINDSLMPFYTCISSNKDSINGYEKVYNPSTNHYKYTHGIVSKNTDQQFIKSTKENKFVVHHKDFNKLNNHPNNLERMSNAEHLKLHEKYNIINLRNPKYEEKRLNNLRKKLSSKEHRNNLSKKMKGIYPKYFEEYNNSSLHYKHNEIRRSSIKSLWTLNKLNSDMMRYKFDETCLQFIINEIKNTNKFIGLTQICKNLLTNKNFINYYKSINCNSNRKIKKSINSTTIHSLIKHYFNKSFCDLIEENNDKLINNREFKRIKTRTNNIRNHKVLKIEKIIEQSDVYCMTVMGPNNEHDRHNFAVCSKDENNNFTRNGVFVSNCQNGDFFLYNEVLPDIGIINSSPIRVNEIEREEGYDKEDPHAVRFKWISRGNKYLENWQVSHFRIISNDLFLPYGSSILEPARRIHRQLTMYEDAMLTYRLVRSPERRVFYIDVGHVPPNEVPNYLESVKSALRSKGVIDRQTGKEDMRYNAQPIAWDSIIPLLDGRNITIKQLAEEYEQGKTNWVHSISDKTTELLPGKVIWCGKNYTANKLIKVTLDDGSFIKTAPEHGFILRNNKSKRADELKIGESLMPFYRKFSSKNEGDRIVGYPKIYDPNTEEYKFIHRVTANSVLYEQREKCRKNTDWNVNNNLVVHHKDINILNSSPENLEWMGNVDHINLHSKIGTSGIQKLIEYSRSPEGRKKTIENNIKLGLGKKLAALYNNTELHKSHNILRKQAQLKSWIEDRENRCKAMRWKLPVEGINIVKSIIINNPTFGRRKIQKELLNNQEFIKILQETNKLIRRDPNKFSTMALKNSLINDYGYIDGLNGLKKEVLGNGYIKLAKNKVNQVTESNPNGLLNHKIVNIEVLEEECDVYCMTVVGPNGEEDRHNFAVLTNDSLYASQHGGIIIKNSILDDYYIPVRGESSGTKIETLTGGQHITATEDVEYIQSKLFAALQVPKPYLNYTENMSAKATAAQLDVRFSRTINSLQKIVISELNKLAMIHLYAKGFDGSDLIDFELKLSNPSSVALQQKLELWSVKFDLAGAAKETRLVDENWIQKNILELSNDEIKDIIKGLRVDRLRDIELESIEPVEPNMSSPPKTTDTFNPINYKPVGQNVPKGPNPNQSQNQSSGVGIDSDDENNFNIDGIEDNKSAPVKATPILNRNRKNRIRRMGVGRGIENMAMPDHAAMLSPKNKYNKDITGLKTESAIDSWTKESLERLKEMEETKDYRLIIEPNIGKEMNSILRNLESKLKISKKNSLLNEDIDILINEHKRQKDILSEIVNQENQETLETIEEKTLLEVFNSED